MKKRIFRSVAAVSLIVLTISSLVFAGVYRRNNFKNLKAQILTEVSYSTEGVNLSGEQYLQNTAIKSDNRVVLFSPDGTVLFDNKTNGAVSMYTDGVKKAVKEGVFKGVFSCYVLLDNGNVLMVSGQVKSSLPVALVPFFLMIAFSLILSNVFSAKSVKSISEPINKIDLENPLSDSGNNNDIYKEIAPLLKRINHQSRQIDEQLREMRIRQQEFSTITENMREGFVIIDKNANILSYNSSALHLFGVEDTKAGEAILKLSSSESFKEAARTALNEYHNESYVSYDERRYLLISNPVTNNYEIIGAIIIILDVTEKEERDNLRREFTANVSHELKTPLTSISGFAEILKNGLVKNEDVVRFAENIYDEAQRMIVLIGDIMKLSQLDEDAIPIEKGPVDIYDVALSVIERLLPSATKNNVSVEITGVHATIIGGIQILDEMIFNLVDNAIKYNKPDGKVLVTVSKGRGFVRLSVEDTGIGIPSSEKERVFERFYRVDKSHSKDIGGTGLGLSIVKHGAIYHNAKVELRSELGKGTVVTLTFNNA